MADFNIILDAGNVSDGTINVVNEIPMGSNLKVEWNRKKAIFELDRVEPEIFAKPCNYGFIPQTLDEDGDELDVLLVCGSAIPTGVVVRADFTDSISKPTQARIPLYLLAAIAMP